MSKELQGERERGKESKCKQVSKNVASVTIFQFTVFVLCTILINGTSCKCPQGQSDYFMTIKHLKDSGWEIILHVSVPRVDALIKNSLTSQYCVLSLTSKKLAVVNKFLL